jgi:hypothetical protein
MVRPSYIATLLLALASSAALAGPDLEEQLAEFESEARALGSNMPGLDNLGVQTGRAR